MPGKTGNRGMEVERTDVRTRELVVLIWARDIPQRRIAQTMNTYTQRLTEMLAPNHIVTDDEYLQIREAIQKILLQDGRIERKTDVSDTHPR
jgi:hypothetical protein